MTTPDILPESPVAADRRAITAVGQATLAGVQSRGDDVESTKGIRSVAMLFRVMSGLLVLLTVLQVLNGLGTSVEISYGVLAAQALRLIIFAGLLWGAADLADLSVKSHCDLRAVRVLLGRIAYAIGSSPLDGDSGPVDADAARGRDALQ
jgi:hypothetical protein